jgi:hypothetical protein
VHNDDDDDVDIIQLVVNNAQNNYSYGMKLTPTTEDTSYSNTTTDGELILLLLRLHRVDITHRVDTTLSTIVS